jgi:NAD/NADP transhydrogenase alpha subunit
VVSLPSLTLLGGLLASAVLAVMALMLTASVVTGSGAGLVGVVGFALTDVAGFVATRSDWPHDPSKTRKRAGSKMLAVHEKLLHRGE